MVPSRLEQFFFVFAYLLINGKDTTQLKVQNCLKYLQSA